MNNRTFFNRSSIVILVGTCLLWPLAGCLNKRGEMGVRNYWRDPSLATFQKGHSTESDVMRALGPPSQVIALQDQTLFYYLREQSRTKAMFLIVYNQTRQQITYDRAIFFFDKQAMLTDFAFSKEAISNEK
jgi:outer membrane protein assembly factor BamE (lipoprotein component of BamABCDE complex)